MAHVFRLCLSSPPSCPEAGAALHAIALGNKDTISPLPSFSLFPNHHNSMTAGSTASSNKGRRLPNLLPNSGSEGDGGGARELAETPPLLAGDERSAGDGGGAGAHRGPSSPGRQRGLGGRRQQRESFWALHSRPATRARRTTVAARIRSGVRAHRRPPLPAGDKETERRGRRWRHGSRATVTPTVEREPVKESNCMAESLLLPIVRGVIGKATDALVQKVTRMYGVDGDRRKLERQLLAVERLLADAESKSETNPAVKRWMKDLNTADDEADDVLDEFQFEVLHREAMSLKSLGHKVRSYMTPLEFHFTMRRKLAKVLKKINELVEEMNTFGLLLRDEPQQLSYRQTYSVLPSNELDDIFGRDDDKELLQKELQKAVGRRRFLLVLDDVWNEEKKKWEEDLKPLLSSVGGGDGSVILVTTQSQRVASIMGTLEYHNPACLSDDDSWELFSKKAFSKEVQQQAELVTAGKLIVKKCKGLPLALKTMGVFPKDHEMDKEVLIQLWMANGFIQEDETMGLEQKGEYVFCNLVWRSFLQDVKPIKTFSFTADESIICCKTHDLMHDLAKDDIPNFPMIMK
uniref:Rx N-terminal domain-containing protein n=1 Tax=Oryza rufipogon TaxID=4529 RepID=A0A0E0NDL0_ORYRU